MKKQKVEPCHIVNSQNRGNRSTDEPFSSETTCSKEEKRSQREGIDQEAGHGKKSRGFPSKKSRRLVWRRRECELHNIHLGFDQLATDYKARCSVLERKSEERLGLAGWLWVVC
jgi:hypothetical protein